MEERTTAILEKGFAKIEACGFGFGVVNSPPREFVSLGACSLDKVGLQLCNMGAVFSGLFVDDGRIGARLCR